MADLEAKLKEADAAGSRFKLVATDGVFSMDGYLANLPAICDLAERHGAMVMVDDSHAVGFIGEHGRGTHEHHHVMGRVDILTGTLGKALGGASGGYISSSKEVDRHAPPALPAVPVLQHPGPLPSSPPASACWACCGKGTACAGSCAPTRRSSAPAWRCWASSCFRASTRSSR